MEPDFVVQDDGGAAEAAALWAAAEAEAITPSNAVTALKPNKRQKNPLGDYASYTYQAVLAMITPEAYQKFAVSGRKNIDIGGAGTFLIAQSGGINNRDSTRAAGFKLDYYIDDLKISSSIAPGKSLFESVVTDITFNIIEPYGFSFPTKLKEAARATASASALANMDKIGNATKHLFILGIRFLGYDEDGKVIDSSVKSFDRYYDINITKMGFKLDGRVTTYGIKAVTIPTQASMSVKRGMIDNEAIVVGGDVNTVLTALCDKLSQAQKDAHPVKGTENTFSVSFRGPGADQIKNASLISKADLDKSKWPMSLDINDGPRPDLRQVVFKSGTPIPQAIRQLISQSKYLEDALKVVYTTADEPNSDKKTPDEIIPATNKTIAWYNITSEVTPKAWDPVAKDFAYDIVYVIQPYQTPFVLSALANKTAAYYGPIKLYDYLFTGKNSEVLRFEQTLNATYFTVALSTDSVKETSPASGGSADISVTPNKPQDTVKLGRANTGSQAAGNYVTSLLDPAAWAKAKIEILGDPDWLVHDSPPSDVAGNFDPYYGSNGYTINPTSGQVFVEISFNEAIDYDNATGLLNVNDKILFWDYSPDIAKVLKGISYQIHNVTSTFKGGAFKQELQAVLNPFSNFGSGTKATAINQRAPDQATTTTEVPATGLSPSPPIREATARDQIRSIELAMTKTQEADDDASTGPARAATVDDTGRGAI